MGPSIAHLLKINNFADRERHQLFIEPEGWKTCEVYVNGFQLQRH
jgi:tRNA U34 5-carboxymethylaminomethyl modifying enzyme MnmG/GidA